METREAVALGNRLTGLLQGGQVQLAHELLQPVLATRTRFQILGRIGDSVGTGSLGSMRPFLDMVAADGTEGGWVVIGCALSRQLDRHLAAALAWCRDFVEEGDVWYAADILAERVPGPALVTDVESTVALLAPWRSDENRWVRRSVGVAIHFWAKRSRGRAELADQAAVLLDFVEPMFEEWDMDAVKGVGWGLKTLGRFYGDQVADWLIRQVERRHRALILHKALTYLTGEQRARVTGVAL